MNKMNKTLLAIAIVLGGIVSAELINGSNMSTVNAADCGCATEAAPCDSCTACESAAPCVEEVACTKARRCGCKKSREPRCKRERKACCPSCQVECDSCTLKLDHYEEDKICFKTEQKIVCIPPVRFPWDKCCPPGKSKTRTVNVLKIHKYKCKKCGYKWDVDPPAEPCEPCAAAASVEPTEAQPISLNPAAGAVDPVVGPVENGVLMPPAGVPQPAFETSAQPSN